MSQSNPSGAGNTESMRKSMGRTTVVTTKAASQKAQDANSEGAGAGMRRNTHQGNHKSTSGRGAR